MERSIFEFSQTIVRYNKEGKYIDALKYFKEYKSHFTSEQITGNDFLIASMLKALRQTNNVDAAFKFLDLYKISISENTKELVLNAYGWLLHAKLKSELQAGIENETDEENFEENETSDYKSDLQINKTWIVEQIERLIPLLFKYEDPFSYSVFSQLFTTVLKAEKKKANANWKFVNDFCDLVNPGMLKTDCRTIEVLRKGEKKSMELASDKETWYSYKSKALFKLEKYLECFEVSKTALETFSKFHYSNDVWFARRIALCKKQLGNRDEAIQELNQVLRRKKDWFIQRELAELYKEDGNFDKAFTLAIDAVNNYGDLEYKVELLCLIGELLKTRGEKERAFKHYSLSRLIRINEEWKIPDKLTKALEDFRKDDIQVGKLPELEKELKKYWTSLNQNRQKTDNPTSERIKGKIDKILHNDEKGADGFIKYDGNKSVYFRVSPDDAIKSKIRSGLPVDFKILPATNGKKVKAFLLQAV